MEKRVRKVALTFLGLFLLGSILMFVHFSHFGGLTGFVVFDETSKKVGSEVVQDLIENGITEVIVDSDEEIDHVEKGKVVSEFSSGGIALEIDKDDLRKLVKDRKVKYIEPVREFEIFLTEVVDEVNSEDVWKLGFENGVNLTGADQTVCVIDTGIDFGHDALIGKNKTACLLNCINQVCVEDCSENDMNGHGTHVAGIIGAHGAVNGSAIGVGLIGLKVFPGDSGGGATTTGIKNAIDWCVDNSENYNISVVSMSLGTLSLYSEYCDSSYPSFSNSIGRAYDQNISVVVATGNSGSGVSRSEDSISSPSCIEKAVPVSATDNGDGLSGYGHFNDKVKLLARGSSVSSSCIGNTVCARTGTSMSAPTVSAGFAVFNQLLKYEDKYKSVWEIEEFIYNNSKKINTGNLELARIDFLTSVLKEENILPNIMLLAPDDGNLISNGSQQFSCSASDWGLQNLTLQIWDLETGAIVLNSVESVSGVSDEIYVNVTELAPGSYAWNCLAEDVGNNLNYNVNNFTLNVGGIAVTLESPDDDFHTNNNNISLECRGQSGSGNVVQNLTFNFWNSSGDLIDENLNTGLDASDLSIQHNFTISEEGTYYWNCLVNGNSSSFDIGDSNYTLFYDLTVPNLTVSGPANGSTFEENEQVGFDFSVDEALDVDCDLIIGETNYAVDIGQGLSQSYGKTFNAGEYFWHIRCSDLALNIVDSEVRVITINEATQSSGDSGGGGESGDGASGGSGGSSGRRSNEGSSSGGGIVVGPSGNSGPALTDEEKSAEIVISNEEENNFTVEEQREVVGGISGRAVDEEIRSGGNLSIFGMTIIAILVIILAIMFVTKRRKKRHKLPDIH